MCGYGFHLVSLEQRRHRGAMSLANFTPGYVMKHPDDFLGPVIASVIIQAIELGIVVNQALRFFSRIAAGKKESLYVKATLVVTLAVMLFVSSKSLP